MPRFCTLCICYAEWIRSNTCLSIGSLSASFAAMLCHRQTFPAISEQHYRNDAGLSNHRRRHTAIQQLLSLDLLDPAEEGVVFPHPASPAIPDLPVFTGLGCPLCPFTARLESILEKHCQKVHPSSRRRGRPSTCTLLASRPQYWIPTRCQRFFVQGP